MNTTDNELNTGSRTLSFRLMELRLNQTWSEKLRDNYLQLPIAETDYPGMYAGVLSVAGLTGCDDIKLAFLSDDEVQQINAKHLEGEMLPLRASRLSGGSCDVVTFDMANIAVTFYMVKTLQIGDHQVVLGLFYPSRHRINQAFVEKVRQKTLRFRPRVIGRLETKDQRILTWDLEEIAALEFTPPAFVPLTKISFSRAPCADEITLGHVQQDRSRRDQIDWMLDILRSDCQHNEARPSFEALLNNKGEYNLAALSECDDINPSYSWFFARLLADLHEFCVIDEHTLDATAAFELGMLGWKLSQTKGERDRTIDDALIYLELPDGTKVVF